MRESGVGGESLRRDDVEDRVAIDMGEGIDNREDEDEGGLGKAEEVMGERESEVEVMASKRCCDGDVIAKLSV